MPSDASVGGAGVNEQAVSGNAISEGGGVVAIPDCLDSSKLLSEFLYRLGNRSDVRERAKVWFDQAYRVVAKKYRFRELEVISQVFVQTEVGVRDYPFPTDAWLIRSIRDLQNHRFFQDKDWTDLERVTPSVGRPSRWARHGYTIILDPTPEAVFPLKVRIKAKPPTLVYPVTGAEQLYIPCEWTEAVIRLALSIGHGALPGGELESDQAMTLYRQYLEDAIEVEVEEERDLEQTLRPRSEK